MATRCREVDYSQAKYRHIRRVCGMGVDKNDRLSLELRIALFFTAKRKDTNSSSYMFETWIFCAKR